MSPITLHGRRCAILWGAAVFLLHAGFSSPAAADGRVAGGDFEFYVDAACFRSASGEPVQEVYLRIPNSEVRFKEQNGRYQAKIRVSIVITGLDGRNFEDEWESNFHEQDEAGASSTLQFQTLVKKYKLGTGSYQLECTVEDLFSPKVTVMSIVRGKHKSAHVRQFPLDVPEYAEGDISLSDAKFLWSVDNVEGEAIYHPNAARLYGLYNDTLRVYVELYVPDETTLQGDIVFASVVLDENGAAVKRESVRLPKPAAEPKPGAANTRFTTFPILISKDLTELPAGRYALYFDIEQEGRPPQRVRGGKFGVAWDMRTWEISRRHFLAEARFLLDPEEYEAFRRKSVGEQETALKKMWKEIDPDPRSGLNEAYEKFLQRLDYVNSHFSDYQMGLFTDRGLIFLKYGPPDELIADVVPLNRESISDALQKVQDKYHAVNFSNQGARMGYARPSRDIIIDPRRLGMVGEGGDVAYPYELWIYNKSGDPILPRDRSLEPDIGLRFIFIDSEGYGRYKLESSSSLLNK